MPKRFTLSLLLTAWIGASTVAPSRISAQIPSPEDEFGFPCGADFKMLGWGQIVDYYNKLGSLSDRIEVRELGKTHQGRPFIVAAISSEANMAKLDRLR